jgi:hypothetical protein
MIRPHNMLSIFLLLQSHIDFLWRHEARSPAGRAIGGKMAALGLPKRKPAFSWGSTSRAVPLNSTLCVFFKLSGTRLHRDHRVVVTVV